MAICKRQTYHLEPPEGLMNDPNGLSWFRGKYYVFFQWNRFRKDHSHKEWGLFTSKDLVSWEFQGGALLPEEPYEHSGVHSGSAMVVGQRLYLYYTGSDKDGAIRRSHQCLAVSEDGRHFEKEGVILETPAGFTGHFRDPKVLETPQNGYYMVIGAQQKKGRGAIALCHSMDGAHWRYSHLLAASNEYEMVECPDLFAVNGHDILLYCPQKRNNEHDLPLDARAVYRLVSFDEATGTLTDTDLDHHTIPLEDGFDCYAPQTFETNDGRRLLWAWMSRLTDAQESALGADEPRIHCLTIPRELSLRNGRLCQMPARELGALLGEALAEDCGPAAAFTATLDTRTYQLVLKAAQCPPGLHVDLGEAALHWDGETLSLVRQNWAGEAETRTRRLHQLDEIEVWADTSSLEIFVNKGESVFSARVFPQSTKPQISIQGMPQQHRLTIRRIHANNKINLGGITK